MPPCIYWFVPAFGILALHLASGHPASRFATFGVTVP